jgi:benzoyl-CoA reductase subunit BamC
MKLAPGTRRVKRINVNVDKCIGCGACEVACSAFHASPQYGSVNPARSRIRMVVDEIRDIYVPVRATHCVTTECAGRTAYAADGKEYDACGYCGASCPSRDWFKEPDSGLPLKCDLCEDDPPVESPLCVQVCRVGALTYEEYEEDEAEGPAELGEAERALEALIDRHGLQPALDAFLRMKRRG